MEWRQYSTTLEYVLRKKKLEVANCEAISQSLLFEKALEEWNARMEEVEREEEKENSTPNKNRR